MLRKGIMLMLIVLMVASTVLSGCAQQKAVVEDVAPAPEPRPTPSAPAEEAVEVETNQKNAAEETEETLEQLLPDGVYESEEDYETPAGTDTFEIKLTVEGDVIQDASLTAVTTHDVSVGYMESVGEALPDLVVGKNVGDVEIPTVISGSSLTAGAVKKYFDGLV